MNHLAHLLLAHSRPASIIGNLAGDFVKGPLDNTWPPAIRAGIQLHRRIDSYTDAHPTVKASRKVFSLRRRRFAGVILDVAFDYFLSLHWDRFHGEDRRVFISRVYSILTEHQPNLPGRLRQIAPVMVRRDWLARCETLAGAGEVLDRIASRSPRAEPLVGSIEEVVSNLETLEASFLAYFPEAVEFAKQEKARLANSM